MGLRGPARTPTAELEARGSWLAAARKKEGEPMGEVLAPPCPKELSPAAKAEWDWAVAELIKRRTLTVLDKGMLAIMCIEYVRYMMASEALDRLYASGKKFKGHMIDHPSVRVKGA